MFGEDLNVRVTSSTADFQAGMQAAQSGLSDVRGDALKTAGAMQILQGRFDEAGDEATTAGAKAGASSSGFLALAGSAATTQIAFDTLSVATTATLIPSMLALSTVMAPLLAAMGGFVAVAGSIVGVGLVGFLGAAATRSDQLKGTFQTLTDTLKSQLAPVFDIFAGVLDKLMKSLTATISEMSVSRKVIQKIADQFLKLGEALISVLPAFVDLAVELTNRFLPAFTEWAEGVLPQIPGMIEGLIPVMLEVGEALKPLVSGFIDIAPTMTKFGMTVLNTVVPALTTFLNYWDRAMQAVNRMDPALQGLVTKVAILGPVIAGLATTLGGPFLSVLTTVGGLIGGTLVTGLVSLASGLTTVLGIIGGATGTFLAWSGVTAAIGSALASVSATVISLGGTLSVLSPTLAGIIGVVASATTSFSAFLAPLVSIVTSVGSFGVALVGVLGPIGLLVAAIGVLGYAIKNNRQVIAKFANKAITLLQNVIRKAATWIQANGPRLVKKAFRMVGEGIRFVALDIYNAITGNDDSILRSLILDIGSWIINKGPGILKKAITTALDVIWAAAKGLYDGLIGNSLIPDMFQDIASYISTTAKSLLSTSITTVIEAIKTAANYIIGTGDGTLLGDYKNTLEAIASWLSSTGKNLLKSAFNTISTVISDIWSGLKKNVMETIENLIDELMTKVDNAVQNIKSAWNDVVPDELDIEASFRVPEVTIGGGSIPGTDRTLPEKDVPGTGDSYGVDETLDFPQLDTGGFIEEGGMAQLHQGEQVVPAAQVDRNGGGDGGTTIQIGKIEASGRKEGREAGKALKQELRSHNF